MVYQSEPWSYLWKILLKMIIADEEPNQKDWELMNAEEQHSLIYTWGINHG